MSLYTAITQRQYAGYVCGVERIKIGLTYSDIVLEVSELYSDTIPVYSSPAPIHMFSSFLHSHFTLLYASVVLYFGLSSFHSYSSFVLDLEFILCFPHSLFQTFTFVVLLDSDWTFFRLCHFMFRSSRDLPHVHLVSRLVVPLMCMLCTSPPCLMFHLLASCLAYSLPLVLLMFSPISGFMYPSCSNLQTPHFPIVFCFCPCMFSLVY